jgi:hypothetical protein
MKSNVEVLFYPMILDVRKSIALSEEISYIQ